MKTPGTSDNLYFLSGGGEMGELTRNFDWSKTSLGMPSEWPQSLCTTLGIILHSSFPMFLFWGKEMICFYNDAFRPSLGKDGKHPAVGKKGKELWAEIWDIVGPMIESVIAKGEPVYFEDQLIPYYRNGKIEDIYWTFSYSPAYGDDGKINGVFVTCIETTKQLQTRKTSEKNELQMRAMVESAPFPIGVYIGKEMVVEFANQSIMDIWGKGNNVIGKSFRDVLPELDNQEVFKQLDQVFLTGKAIHITNQKLDLIIDNKIRPYYFNYSLTPLFDNSGKVYGVMNTGVDLTDLNLARIAIQKSEENLRNTILQAPVAMCIFKGADHVVELANTKMFELWGKPSEAVMGKPIFEGLPEAKNQGFEALLDNVYHTGKTFSAQGVQITLPRNGGIEPVYVNFVYEAYREANGFVSGILAVAIDVTEQIVAQQKIEESERNIRNMVLQAPVAMCILLGPTHIVEVANELMIELWGKPSEAVMGKPIFEGLPDAKEQGLEQLLMDVYTTGKTFKANEAPIDLVRNGKPETVYQNFVYDPYKGNDGAILGVLAISIDVTEQVLARQKIEEVVKERTKELEKANNNLQKSNAELAQFAYIASHDLQEPLRKISTFTQMLESRIGDQLDAQSKNYFNKINSSSLRMNTLIRDVLTYSELVKDTEIFNQVNLNDIVANTITDYELLIEQKHAVINYKDLPVIEAIPLQMSQLFGNIIGNSLKFARKDVKPVMTISCLQLTQKEKELLPDQSLDYIKIQFKDNGIGFKEEYIEKIFHIFQRLHRKSEYEGTGIGLAMCKKIALNHHGDLNAIGSSENGAVFNAILPLKQHKN